jgi:uracil-DNA glycosylase
MRIGTQESTWNSVLKEDLESTYFSEIVRFLKSEKEKGAIVYPPSELIFQAFDATPFDKVKVVILGQDPYHGEGQAHGLCFSVPQGIKQPPSLQNIFRELQNCYPAYKVPMHGCLMEWANQGVFMLNSIMTVRANEAASHSKIGWELFTDNVIRHLSEKHTNLVFLLWGAFAKSKSNLIDAKKHLVLSSGHPSFASSHKQFFGNLHFVKCNEYLMEKGLTPIDWQIKIKN